MCIIIFIRPDTEYLNLVAQYPPCAVAKYLLFPKHRSLILFPTCSLLHSIRVTCNFWINFRHTHGEAYTRSSVTHGEVALKGLKWLPDHPLRDTHGRVFYTRWSVQRVERTQGKAFTGQSVHRVERTQGRAYTGQSVHRVERIQGRAYTRWRHIHGETYVRWCVHMVKSIHGGVYTP